jgi:hypothetical protein
MMGINFPYRSNGKVIPTQSATKAKRGGKLQTFLNLLVNRCSYALAVIPPVQEYLREGWVGPRARLDAAENKPIYDPALKNTPILWS